MSFNTASASGAIKREVSLYWFCKQLKREFGITWVCPALTVFGLLPESQRLVSSLPADLAYFNPECVSLSFSLSPSPSVACAEFTRPVHSGGKFELWQPQRRGLVSGPRAEEGAREMREDGWSHHACKHSPSRR